MSVPNIQVTIYFPGLGQWRDVSKCVDSDTVVEISEAIEAPAETNSYVAPDIQLKLREGTADEFLLSWFDSIQPDDLNWTVEIKFEGIPIFTGFVLPTSLQVDTREAWAGFTAIGKAGLLARTSADTETFKRAASSGWTVLSVQGNAATSTVTISKTTPQNTCEYVTNDILGIDMGGGSVMEVKVLSIAGTGTAPPYASFTLTVEGMDPPATIGAAVTLLTRFYRDINLRIAVQALFAAAGLAVPQTANYNVLPISNASSPFSTRPVVAGIGGSPLAIIPNVYTNPRYHPIIGTTTGTYIQYDPPLGAWQEAPGYIQGAKSIPNDWTDDSTFTAMGFVLYGPRYEQATSGANYVYTFWHYWIVNQTPAPPYYRFGLTVTVSKDPDLVGDYTVTTGLLRQSSPDGIVWTTTHSVAVAAGSLITDVDLHKEIGETVGIYSTGIRNSSGKLFFTHPNAGSLTDYTAATVSLADLTGYTAVADIRGKVRRDGVFWTDTFRGSTPTAYICSIAGDGSPSVTSQVSLPVGFVPHTLTYNDGDGFWYALAVTEEGGVQLLSYTSSRLGPRAGYIPTQIEATGPPGRTTVELTCIRTPNLPSGAWPMMALVGTSIWWISYSFPGIIPYLDFEGLSCADALAQLGVTVDAFFYVDAGLDTHFRSRSAYSSRTIDTGVGTGSTRIDDAGCVSLRRASIWYKSVKYVTMTNERDEAITGSAGDAGFKGTEQSLDNVSRFVTTVSFAQALAQNTYNYLARKLTLVDVEHELDGRRYEVGRTFTASVDGVVKTFQIVSAVIRPKHETAHIQGLEM